MSDKRRYTPETPYPNRDKHFDMAGDVMGNAGQDGFTAKYRKPLKRDSYDRSRSPYTERFVCDGLLTEDDARMRDSGYGNPYD